MRDDLLITLTFILSHRGRDIERSMAGSCKHCFISFLANASHVEENGFILSLEPDIETINGVAVLFPTAGNQSLPPFLTD
jgi:hypothetical protein